MVNVVYLGVVRVFKDLQAYWQDFNHVLTGVDGKRTRIVAKLVGVPLELGEIPGKHVSTPSTFYVIESDDYHWILGLPLLADVGGKVLCRERSLEYLATPVPTPQDTTPPPATTQLPLVTRTQAREQPVRALFRLRSPHLEAESAAVGSWQEALLTTEETEYVGEGLAQLLGGQRLVAGAQGSMLGHPQASIGGVTYQVDEGLMPGQLQEQGNGHSTEVLVE